MTTTYYFLDTEWADEAGSELASLALVSEDGSRCFYAERAHLSPNPTDFVRQNVYPLLDRGKSALTDVAFTTDLRTFLQGSETPSVIADFPNDLRLLRHALDRFELSADQATPCRPKPNPVMTRMLKEGLMGLLVEDWFAAHPEQIARRHHALVDAQALRIAWLVTTKRVPAPWWAHSYQRNQS